jgi:hypothetical protein
VGGWVGTVVINKHIAVMSVNVLTIPVTKYYITLTTG